MDRGTRNERLRVGLISGISHQDYLSAAFAANPSCELVVLAEEPTVAERDRAAGPRLAAKRGIPFVEDVDAMLARPDVDVVCIGCENTRHARLTLRAIASGKHVLVDKPYATTLADCREVARAAEEAEKRGQVISSVSRYASPAILRARDAVAAGRIGELRAIHAEICASYGSGEAFSPAELESWGPARNGGGELMMHGMYPVTNIRYVTGAEVASVQCFSGTLFNRRNRELGIEDAATVILRLTDGSVADVFLSRSHTPLHPTHGDIRLRIVGTRGMLDADEHKPALSVYGTPETGIKYLDFDVDVIQGFVDRYVDAVLAGTEPPQRLVDALRVMETIFAAIESARTGSTVSLREMLDRL